MFSAVNVFEGQSIPKDFYINQRGLLAELDIIITDQKWGQESLDYYQLTELKRLKVLIGKARVGQTFEEMVIIWKKTANIISFLGDNSNHYQNNPRYKYYWNILTFKNNEMNNENQITGIILMDIVNSLLRTYKKVKLFPQVLGRGVLDLFKSDYTIHLTSVLNLYDYAIFLVKQSANTASKMGADDNFIVLKELLDPLLFKQDLLNETVFNNIYNNVRNWYPKEELKTLTWDFPSQMSAEEKNDMLDLQLSHCAEIQAIILNSLHDLRHLQLLEQQPLCEVYCKKLYN